MSTVALCLGFLYGILLVSVLNVAFRGVWMPIGLAGVLGYVLELLPRMRSGSFKVLAAIAFGFISTSLWMSTATMLPISRGADLARSLIWVFAACGGFFIAFAALAWRRLQAPERPPAGWLVALFAMGCIVAVFSSGAGGSDPMIAWVQARLGLGPEEAHTLVVVVRKSIHFTYYALTGWIAWRLARGSGAEPGPAALFAALGALSIACFDEMRQSGIAGRSGSAWDVLLDMAGVGLALILATRSLRSKRLPAGV